MADLKLNYSEIIEDSRDQFETLAFLYGYPTTSIVGGSHFAYQGDFF